MSLKSRYTNVWPYMALVMTFCYSPAALVFGIIGLCAVNKRPRLGGRTFSMWMIGINAVMTLFTMFDGSLIPQKNSQWLATGIGLAISAFIWVRYHTPLNQDRPAKQTYIHANPYAGVETRVPDTIAQSASLTNLFYKGSPFYTRKWLNQHCNVFNMEIINNCGGRLLGVPGKGLASSGFNEAQIEAGELGEQNLAKLMILAGMMNYTTTFWSMSIPDTEYDTDVDCIVLDGDDTIYLIDAKLYKTHPGTHYESNGFDKLWLKNDMDGSIIKTYTPSRNMLMAVDKYSKRFPKYKVVPIMALCPNVSGSPAVAPGTALFFRQSHGYKSMPVMSAVDLVPALVNQVKRVPYTDKQRGMVYELERYIKW